MRLAGFVREVTIATGWPYLTCRRRRCGLGSGGWGRHQHSDPDHSDCYRCLHYSLGHGGWERGVVVLMSSKKKYLVAPGGVVGAIDEQPNRYYPVLVWWA